MYFDVELIGIVISHARDYTPQDTMAVCRALFRASVILIAMCVLLIFI